jgi:hypothetical protein
MAESQPRFLFIGSYGDPVLAWDEDELKSELEDHFPDPQDRAGDDVDVWDISGAARVTVEREVVWVVYGVARKPAARKRVR